ncbi:hypothetical protein LOCC1_G002968 [Lachnellula occidentalis]|uniref:Glyoxalase-like domain-containing protein n=1 Tax=Lachnellula occidentalis TaxID=215460 RepID=A0A8H8S558_9HELO|nr:hypothetical protein LOCC1_G002968 [Lachnellula occidentalis]
MSHLDHIIILIPHAHLIDLPAWLTENFTITSGGRHADNKTENKLICFKDGSYIELISFINDDPVLREGHWWGKKTFGIIDFAFTSKGRGGGGAEENYEPVSKRLEEVKWEDGEEEVRYQRPVEGGRKRDDGVDVKWQVTFPVVSDGYQRGELPFFCHDITDREVRVPFSKECVTHPSGAYGIQRLAIFVPRKRAKALEKAYAAILGVDSEERGVFGTEPLKGEGAKVEYVVRDPEKGWQKEEMKRRGGLLLGDLEFLKDSAEGRKLPLTRIDAEGFEVAMGGWFL